MIGLDTNILVRYLTQDSPSEVKKVNAFIEEGLERGTRFFINPIVLCELVWVLESAYDYPKATIVETLEKILVTSEFMIDRKDEIRKAVLAYKSTRKTDFSDCLIGHYNKELGCDKTVSLDRALIALTNLFEVL